MAHHILSSTKVEEVAPVCEMITIDSRANIAETLHTLIQNNIMCAPVYDQTKEQYLGLVDMLDLVTLLVDIVKNSEQLGQDYKSYMSGDEFKQRTASDMVDLSNRNKMCPVAQGASLLEAMTIMAQNHVQRVPVMGKYQDGGLTKVVSLLTQSAVVAFLAQHSDQLSGGLDQPLHTLGFEPKHIVSIDEEKPALDAFRLMAEHRITGIPVLDSDGKLLAHISARDLRVIASDPKMFQYLYMEAGDFVTHIRMSDANPKTMHPSISCTLEESFQRVIAKLAAARIHRIYVTDQQRAPLSVVSLPDIISKIIELKTQ